MTKEIKMVIKEIKKSEKRKKALLKMFKSKSLPKGIKKRDIMASLRGYNNSISTYLKFLEH